MFALEHGAYSKGGNMWEFKQIYQTLSFIMILMTHYPNEITKSIKSNTFTIDNKVINKELGREYHRI